MASSCRDDVGIDVDNDSGGCGAGNFFLAFSIELAAGDVFESSDAIVAVVGLIVAMLVGGNGAFRFPFTCTFTGILLNEV